MAHNITGGLYTTKQVSLENFQTSNNNVISDSLISTYKTRRKNAFQF